MVINDICAVRRNSNDNGDYPEPDPNDADDPFWSLLPCLEFQTIIVPAYGLAGSGDVSTQDATEALDDKECGGPTLIDLYLKSLEPLSPLPTQDLAHHGLYADFEWCRPVDHLPHGCTKLTLCSPETHYETAAPTATSDRGCVVVTRCNADTHYESEAPTPTTDRACTERTRCDLNVTFYRTGGTTRATRCASTAILRRGTEFHANTAAATADTECVEFTECAAVGTEYQSASRTVAADNSATVSEDCPSGRRSERRGEPDGRPRVHALSVCISGEAEGTAPTATADRQCVPVGEPAPPQRPRRRSAPCPSGACGPSAARPRRPSWWPSPSLVDERRAQKKLVGAGAVRTHAGGGRPVLLKRTSLTTWIRRLRQQQPPAGFEPAADQLKVDRSTG